MNKSIFKEELGKSEEREWVSMSLVDTIDKAISEYTQVIQRAKEEAMAERGSKRGKMDTPWGIRILIKERRRLLAKKRPTDRQRINYLNREVRRKLEEWENDKLQWKMRKVNEAKDAATKWKILNAIMGRNRKADNLIGLKREDGSRCQTLAENVETHALRLRDTCSLSFTTDWE